MFNISDNRPGFYVYEGRVNGELVYIGTTTQIPSRRFSWHKSNGKDFVFKVLKNCKDAEEMLDEEFRLICLLKPKYNKIRTRKQNLNSRLTPDEIEKRKGDKEWCQSCLKRRTNSGYEYCYYCKK